MKPSKIALSFLAALTMLAASNVHALSVKDYERVKSSENSEELAAQGLYLMGVFNGLTTANLMLNASGQTKFFCDPANLSLNAGNLRGVIDEALDKAREGGGLNEELMAVDVLLLVGLRRTFPCN